jgi:hypothetical protein
MNAQNELCDELHGMSDELKSILRMSYKGKRENQFRMLMKAG